MNNKNIGLIAVLGVAGYIAYSLYAKSKGGSSGGYFPTTGGGGGSTKKKTLSYDQILQLISATLDTFEQVQLTYNQKFNAIKDLEKMINEGKNQKEIEIAMQTKYKLNPAQVSTLVNRLYK